MVGVVIGAALGYAFGVNRGDLWIGGSIAVTSSVAAYGFLAYPQHRTRWAGPHSKFWYTLIGVLTPSLMLLTPNSPLLSDELSTVVLLGSLWLGGVNAGTALVHESPGGSDDGGPSAPGSASGD